MTENHLGLFIAIHSNSPVTRSMVEYCHRLIHEELSCSACASDISIKGISVKMKTVLKENWKFLLFVLVASLIGGYCTGLYVYDTLSPDMLHQLQEQNVSKNLLAIVTLLQYGIVFGLILAVIGLIMLNKKRSFYNGR